MKREYAWFLAAYGKRLRTHPLLDKYHKSLESAPIAAGSEPDTHDAVGLPFFVHDGAVIDEVDLVLQYSELYGSEQSQDAVDVTAAAGTVAAGTVAAATVAMETGSALGKSLLTRRGGPGLSYVPLRQPGQRVNRLSTSTTSKTPVKQRLDTSEIFKNTFNTNVSSMNAMIEQQNAYLQNAHPQNAHPQNAHPHSARLSNASEPSSAVFARGAADMPEPTQEDADELFMGWIRP